MAKRTRKKSVERTRNETEGCGIEAPKDFNRIILKLVNQYAITTQRYVTMSNLVASDN